MFKRGAELQGSLPCSVSQLSLLPASFNVVSRFHPHQNPPPHIWASGSASFCLFYAAPLKEKAACGGTFRLQMGN